MSEWISVKDRLPTKEECKKDAGWFLVKRALISRADVSRYDGNEKPNPYYDHGWKYAMDESITHWMPLPEPPK